MKMTDLPALRPSVYDRALPLKRELLRMAHKNKFRSNASKLAMIAFLDAARNNIAHYLDPTDLIIPPKA